MLRSARPPCHTVDGLWEVIGALVASFSPTECANYFSACGYDAD